LIFILLIVCGRLSCLLVSFLTYKFTLNRTLGLGCSIVLFYCYRLVQGLYNHGWLE